MKTIPTAAGNTVLVLDGDMIPALTVVRSLARAGLTVDLAGHTADSLASTSRYVRQTLKYPSPMTDGGAFVNWVAEALQRDSYLLAIPATERTLVPLMRNYKSFPEGAIAMAAPDSLALVLDKGRTLVLAQELGIPAPYGLTVVAEAALDEAMAELEFPIVVKPARSVGSDTNEQVSLSVDYALDEHELRAKARHMLRYGQVILQEFFQGQGVGIELIAAHGEIQFAFQHLRLHEVPLTGGGSSLRMSVPIESVLLDAAERLIRALKWHGVAMVEFKWNPQTGEYRLMEINGRLWGSLPLAVAAGADFPLMVYRLYKDGQIGTWPAAKLGVYCRKLSADIYWSELVARRLAPPSLVEIPAMKQVFRDWLLVLSPKHHFDVQQWRDPKPGLVDIAAIIATQLKRISGLVTEKRMLRRQRIAWRRGDVGKRVATAREILFVCYGNINRSALAECYLNTCGTKLVPRIRSAGFHQKSGRPADPSMIGIARANGVDMSSCSSTILSASLVANADVIFVMDGDQLNNLVAAYPGAANRTFLLGMADVAIVPGGIIADPYGRPLEAYQRCFRQVAGCTDKVIAYLGACSRASIESTRAS